MSNGANLILQAAQAGLQNVAPATNILKGLESANLLKSQGLQNQLLQQQLAQQESQAPLQQQLLQQRLQAGEQGLQVGQFELDQARRDRLLGEITALVQEGLALPANARRAHVLNRLGTVDFEGLNEQELIAEINQMDDAQFESALSGMIRQAGGDAELIPSSARAVKVDGKTYMEYETRNGETRRFPVSGDIAKKTTGETIAEQREAEVGQKFAEEAAKLQARYKYEPAVAKEIAIAKAEGEALVEKQIKQEGQLNKIEQADTIYKELSKSDLSMIYGRGESYWPTILRSQDGIDMVKRRDQMVGMLELAAAGEMKGQGQITESERKILKDSATILQNPDISSGLAKRALDEAMALLYKNAGKDFGAPSSPAATTAPTQPTAPVPAPVAGSQPSRLEELRRKAGL